jgi:hypothetical protein
MSTSYLDLHLAIDNEGRLKGKIYHKHVNFTFQIVNFKLISSNISATSTYGVYIFQPIRYPRIYVYHIDVVPSTSKSSEKCSFFCNIVKNWISLPLDIAGVNLLEIFKSQLNIKTKKHVFSTGKISCRLKMTRNKRLILLDKITAFLSLENHDIYDLTSK